MLKIELEQRIDELEDALEDILSELDKDDPDLGVIQEIAEDALGEEETPDDADEDKEVTEEPAKA